MIKKRWTKEEEDLLIKLKKLGYTYKEISIEIGRSAASCIKKYYRLSDPKYIEKEKEYQKEYQKQYREENRDKIVEYKRNYREKNKDQILEQQKQYYQNNKDQILEQQKKYYQNNRDKKLEYQKQYRESNKDKIAEYKKHYYKTNKDQIAEYKKHYYQNNRDQIIEYQRNYHAQNPHKAARKERYNGEFADIKLCHDFYNGISPITGTKDDLQVHHLISVKDNHKFWESATDEEKNNYLILIPKDLHMAYHSWLGGTKVESTPESFWEFINTVYFNE